MDIKNPKIKRKKDSNWLYLFVSVLPPFIFMFYLYGRNSSYINYWHVLLVTLVFALGGLVLYWIAARVGKSPQAATLVSVVLWILFFTITHLRRILLYELGNFYSLLLTLAVIIALSIIVFFFGRRLRKKEPFKIIAVFEIVVFLLNFVPATFSLTVDKAPHLSDYANSFTVDTCSPSPNIYWLFMDGMLGFKAMEDLFDDRQTEFESHLNDRGFLINRDAEFEISHSTAFAIPALMSPHYYDTLMAPLLASLNLNDYNSSMRSIRKLHPTIARRRNELVFAFNAKGYQTNTIAMTIGTYFYPTTTHFYIGGKELKRKSVDISKGVDTIMQLESLKYILSDTGIPTILLDRWFVSFRDQFIDRLLEAELIDLNPSGIDTKSIYGNVYQGGDTWYVDALAEILAEPEPQMTIIHDGKAHGPFVLNEDGSPVGRTKDEGLNPYNYPPQHRFTRDVLVRIIDLIIANDPDAIIVIEADHGLHHETNREQLLAMPGGSAEKVRLMQNQTMSAVRIPEKWGGLDAPLDPLNITRVLVNRYVGPNYELLDSHP